MATYAWDGNGETTGSFSTNWTSRYATISNLTIESVTDAEDDRVHQWNTGDTGICMASLDAVDGDANRANADIVVRFQRSIDDDINGGIWIRASGTGGSETGYLMNFGQTGNAQWQRFNSGSGVSVGGLFNMDQMDIPGMAPGVGQDNFTHFPAGEWVWVRARVNGTGATVTLQAKFWRDGWPEPADWNIDESDTSGSRITANGWCGVGQSTHTGVFDIDFFEVNTNGDTPTFTKSTNTVIRETGEYAQVLVETTNPVVRETGEYAQVLVEQDPPTIRVTGAYAQVLFKVGAGGGGGSAQEGVAMVPT